MDFILGLPKAKGLSVILVVVNKMSKYNNFILIRHPFTTKDVANIFIREIVCLHGFPIFTILDQDRIFISQFW